MVPEVQEETHAPFWRKLGQEVALQQEVFGIDETLQPEEIC